MPSRTSISSLRTCLDSAGAIVYPPADGDNATLNTSLWADDALDGQIAEYTPPPIVIRQIDWPTHTDGIQIVDGGLEALQATLVSLRYTGEFLRVMNRVVVLTCYNALRTEGVVRQLRHELTGLITTVDLGTVTTGTTAPQVTLTQNVRKFRSLQANIDATGAVVNQIVLHDIDIEARKREIGGADQLAGVKAALGLG